NLIIKTKEEAWADILEGVVNVVNNLTLNLQEKVLFEICWIPTNRVLIEDIPNVKNDKMLLSLKDMIMLNAKISAVYFII
ncbi:hypothetical protein A3Q56_02983, partial [Intoshia linei]